MFHRFSFSSHSFKENKFSFFIWFSYWNISTNIQRIDSLNLYVLVFGGLSDGQAYICFTPFIEGNKSFPELIQSSAVKAEGGDTRIRADSIALWMDGSVGFVTGQFRREKTHFFMPETVKELLMCCSSWIFMRLSSTWTLFWVKMGKIQRWQQIL